MPTVTIRGAKLDRYVIGIVTENGIAYPPFEISLKKVVSRQ